jgi:hypothetical protein
MLVSKNAYMNFTERDNKPANSERMASSLNINAGLAKVIANDMLEIPWKLSSPMITCRCSKNYKMERLQTNKYDFIMICKTKQLPHV